LPSGNIRNAANRFNVVCASAGNVAVALPNSLPRWACAINAGDNDPASSNKNPLHIILKATFIY
jgi:hypothetical protein